MYTESTINSTYFIITPINKSVVISNTERIIRILIIAVILILIFLTNGIIATVLYHANTLTHNIKYLIGSLCASDILTGVLLLTTLISAFNEKWIFGEVMCTMSSMVFAHVVTVTLITLSIMLLDKYILLRFPLKYYNIMNRSHIILILFAIWITSVIAIAICNALLNYHHQYSNVTYMCYVELETAIDQRNTVIVGSMITLPFVLIYVFSSIGIYRICHKQRNQINIQFDGASRTCRSTINIKGLKAILITSTVSLASWVPFSVIRTATWLGVKDLPPFVMFLAFMCVFCTSFSNWFIYTKTHTPYKIEQQKTWKTFKLYVSYLTTK